MPYDNFNPIISGMVQGYGLADQIRRAAMERDREQRLTQEAEELSQERELTILERMARGGRAATGGMVTESLGVPGGLSGNLTRKVDPSRYVKYKDRSGNLHEYELYNEDDVMRKTLDSVYKQEELRGGVQMRNLATELAMRGNASIDQAVGQRQAMIDLFGMDFDPDDDGPQPSTRVLPAEYDSLDQAKTRRKPTPKEPTIHASSVQTDDAGKQNLVITWSDGRVEEKPLAGRGKATKTAAAKADPAIKERQTKISSLQSKIDEIEGQKAAIITENQTLGNAKTKKKDDGKILANKAKFHGLVAQQQALQAQKELLIKANGGSQAPAAQGSGGYSVGQSVKLKDGKTVKITKLNSDGTFEYE